MGKENYYINVHLTKMFVEFGKYEDNDKTESIESRHVKESEIL